MQPPENDSHNRSELRQMFMDMDKNNDGTLSKKELEQAIEKAIEKKPGDFLKAIFNDIDINNNGTIDYHEFMLAAQDKTALLSDERLLNAFKKIDSNNDGFITQKSIKKAFGIKDEDIDHFWDSFTKDVEKRNKRQITFDEFREAMRTIAMPRLQLIKNALMESMAERLSLNQFKMARKKQSVHQSITSPDLRVSRPSITKDIERLEKEYETA